MKRQSYYPTRAAEELLWLQNFVNKLAAHAPTLGITTARCAAAIADARWLIYVIGSWLPAVRPWQKACTDASDAARGGEGSTPLALPVFTPPPLPAASGGLPAVVAVAPGALDRIFDLIQDIKQSDTYITAIGMDLGAIGPEKTQPDLAIIQPVIKVRIIAGKVEIDWSWDGLSDWVDQLEIQIDRGNGWAVLTYDTTPGYTDTTPHPATPTKWKYRAIWRRDDQQVGQWSAEVSVTVG